MNKKLFLSVGLSVLVLAGAMSVISLRANAAGPSVSISCKGSSSETCSVKQGSDVTIKVDYSDVNSVAQACIVYEGIDTAGVVKKYLKGPKGNYEFTINQIQNPTSYYVECNKKGELRQIISDTISIKVRVAPTSTPTPTPSPTPTLIPSVIVLSPNGGEKYKAGQKMTISWKTNISSDRTLLIGLHDDRIPSAFIVIIETPLNKATEVSSRGNYKTYEYKYVIPSDFNSFLPAESQGVYGGAHYKAVVNINLSAGVAQQDTSDNLFTISSVETPTPTPTPKPPVIKVLSPTDGEIVSADRMYKINWSINSFKNVAWLYVYLLKGGVGYDPGNYRNSVCAISSVQSQKNKSCIWYADLNPIEDGNDYSIRIDAVDGNNQVLASAQGDNFSIVNYPEMPVNLGSFKLIQPNGGQKLRVDKNYPIKWQWKPADNSNTMLSNVEIELVPSNSYNFSLKRFIVARMNPSGTYNWTPLKTEVNGNGESVAVDPPENSYKIRVSGIVLNKTLAVDVDGKQIREYYFASDLSDATFNVVPKRSTAALIGNFFADILSAPFQYFVIP